MKINNVFSDSAQPQPSNKSSVVISHNPIRERVTLDQDGNEIDMKTKQIIRKNEDI